MVWLWDIKRRLNTFILIPDRSPRNCPTHWVIVAVAVSGVFASHRIPLINADAQLINVPVDVKFQSTHWRSVLTWLLAGHAIGVLQFPVCKNEMEKGALIPLLSHYTVPPFTAWLLHPPAGMMSYETRICASLLEGYLKDSLLALMCQQ